MALSASRSRLTSFSAYPIRVATAKLQSGQSKHHHDQAEQGGGAVCAGDGIGYGFTRQVGQVGYGGGDH